MMLVKTQTLLDFKHCAKGMATFYGDDGRPYLFTIPQDIWEDLGSPRQITITIDSGDLLNVEEADGD